MGSQLEGIAEGLSPQQQTQGTEKKLYNRIWIAERLFSCKQTVFLPEQTKAQGPQAREAVVGG